MATAARITHAPANALRTLARSGDPRACAVLRETVQSGSASDEITATDIRSLANEYGTASDAQMKDALMSQFARSGDRAAVDKLIAIARTDDSPSVRRRAINQLSRMDDPKVKERCEI